MGGKGAGRSQALRGEAIMVVDEQEFPARETGAGVSFAWLWECS